jgi:hypothetical protein
VLTGAITLAQVAQRTEVLAVACSRCDRVGRYRLDTLIAQHGPRFGIPALLRSLSADCPKRKSVSVYDLCGVNCPDMSALFAVQRSQSANAKLSIVRYDHGASRWHDG